MLGTQLLFGTIVVVFTVLLHVASLVYLAVVLQYISEKSINKNGQRTLMIMLTVAVLYILVLHTLEAWIWAAVFLCAGEFDSVADALYFSVVTSTTLGYGDFTLSERWRLLSSFEAMGGLILFGASTAFLLELMRSLFLNENR